MSGTDAAPWHLARYWHQHRSHGRSQESRFTRSRDPAYFACTIFKAEVWNDDKRHVLEFGIIHTEIGFEGAKLLKIRFTDLDGLAQIALWSKREGLACTISSQGALCAIWRPAGTMEAGRNEFGNQRHRSTRYGDAGATETRPITRFWSWFIRDPILWNKGSTPRIL